MPRSGITFARTLCDTVWSRPPRIGNFRGSFSSCDGIEASERLRGEFALDLPEHAIDAVYARTGGWPAGLRLAAAFVRERGWQELGEFRGSGAELYAYFNSEVLGRASRQDQDTLLRWSLLERLEDDEAIVAGGASRELLAQLEQAGLAIRDAGPRGGHRFQPLYAEFLRARARELLPAAEIVELHRTYADRAVTRGDTDRAIHHFQEAGDHRRAAQLVRDHGEGVLESSEVTTLQRWLDGFPPDAERKLPWIILLRGLLHRVRGDYERALAHYREAADGRGPVRVAEAGAPLSAPPPRGPGSGA